MRVSLASIVLAIAAGACASAEPADSTSTPVETNTTSPSSVMTTTGAAPTTAISSRPTASPAPEIDVELVDGEAPGPAVFEVELGESVDIWIRSDADDEIHVHGYDLVYDLEAGEPFHLSFPADVPGVFEVEIHTGHRHLFDIEVRD